MNRRLHTTYVLLRNVQSNCYVGTACKTIVLKRVHEFTMANSVKAFGIICIYYVKAHSYQSFLSRGFLYTFLDIPQDYSGPFSQIAMLTVGKFVSQ